MSHAADHHAVTVSIICSPISRNVGARTNPEEGVQCGSSGVQEFYYVYLGNRYFNFLQLGQEQADR